MSEAEPVGIVKVGEKEITLKPLPTSLASVLLLKAAWKYPPCFVAAEPIAPLVFPIFKLWNTWAVTVLSCPATYKSAKSMAATAP